jgi:fructose-1,6-bisphosphatase/inositol monophosphatase family enzyme
MFSQLIRDVFSADKCVTTKNGYADLVTDTDHHVEQTIIKSLSHHFPQHR